MHKCSRLFCLAELVVQCMHNPLSLLRQASIALLLPRLFYTLNGDYKIPLVTKQPDTLGIPYQSYK